MSHEISKHFKSDPKLAAFAAQTAKTCAAYLQAKFGQVADYSDASVAGVESALALLWLEIPNAKPSQEDIEEFASMFGCYLGETHRRNRGGEWGTGDGGAVSLRTRSGTICYPWARVLKRLTNGPEDNVLHWYQYLKQHDSQGVQPPPLPGVPPPLPAVPPPLPSASPSQPRWKDIPAVPIKKSIELIIGGVERKTALLFLVRSLLHHPLFVFGFSERKNWDPMPYPKGKNKGFAFAYTDPEEAETITEEMEKLGLALFPMPFTEILDDLPQGCHLAINPFGAGRYDIEAEYFNSMREMIKDVEEAEQEDV